MKERSIKELLQILLKSMEGFELGLCLLMYDLKDHQFIIESEHTRLLVYLYENRPDPNLSFGDYYWPQGLKEPRIDWLEQHIKLNP